MSCLHQQTLVLDPPFTVEKKTPHFDFSNLTNNEDDNFSPHLLRLTQNLTKPNIQVKPYVTEARGVCILPHRNIKTLVSVASIHGDIRKGNGLYQL